jgi:hypothetical protein
VTAFLIASLLALGPATHKPPPAQPGAPAQPAQALTDDEIRQRIRTYMGSIDTPIGPERWQALGPRGAGILEQMAQDPNEFPTSRAKAVNGVAAIGSPAAPGLMITLARSEDAPLIVRLTAVRGAEKVVPASQLVAALKPVLETAKDGHVRRAAAEVLSEHGGCALVRAQAGREDEPARLKNALRSCGE